MKADEIKILAFDPMIGMDLRLIFFDDSSIYYSVERKNVGEI